MDQALGRCTAALGGHYAGDPLQRLGKNIVNDEVIVFVVMAHLGRGLGHAIGDHLLAILTATMEALLENRQARRQNEDGLGLRQLVADLAGSLPVDVQKHIDPLIQTAFYGLAGGAIVVAKYLGPFEEGTPGYLGLEFLLVHKVVMHAIFLPRPHGAGGVGDGELHPAIVIVLLQQRVQQTGFSRSAGGGDNKQGANVGHSRNLYAIGRHIAASTGGGGPSRRGRIAEESG